MVPEVAKRNEALRARKEAMAQRILGMDDRKRATQPSDGGFSPAELVAHMAKAEEFNLAFLRKVGPSGLDGRRVKPGVLYGHVLKSFQARKRIGAPPMLVPKKQSDPVSESARWQRMLDELEGYLAQVQSMDGPFIKMNFLFGTLSVAQFFEFQEAHVAYHEHYFPNS